MLSALVWNLLLTAALAVVLAAAVPFACAPPAAGAEALALAAAVGQACHAVADRRAAAPGGHWRRGCDADGRCRPASRWGIRRRGFRAASPNESGRRRMRLATAARARCESQPARKHSQATAARYCLAGCWRSR